MPAYIEISIPETDPLRRDLLVPGLEAVGFDGFEEQDVGLKAYIQEGRLDERVFEAFAKEHLSDTQREGITRALLPDQNWNHTWESGFDPVVIDDFCAIRADFHASVPGVAHDIVITPKMSFGTGHHATTHMMIEQMRGLPLEGKRVLDFGTGTGVLAILAERLGASSVWAIDNDTWSMDNAAENRDRNDAHRVSLHLADTLEGAPGSDVILANINRNTLLEHMSSLYETLADEGWLLLSGILQEDGAVLRQAAETCGFQWAGDQCRGVWMAQLWKKADGRRSRITQNSLT
jgi:ribosomal protein L11 methyltransferase